MPLCVVLLSVSLPGQALLQNLNLLQGATMGVDWIASVPSRAEINGLNELRIHNGYVEVESQQYDFANANSVDLSFDVTVPFNLLGLIGSAPNPGENLRVDYRADDGSWKTLNTFVADNGFLGLISLGNWFTYSASLPTDAYHDSFQIRYVMLGGGYSLFDLLGDNWYVSNINIAADLVPTGPDHYQFVYASPALTCSPQPVTLQACADASCSSLYTDPVTVQLSPSGWVGGSTVSFNGGTASLSLSHTTPEPVTLSVTSSLPATIGGATQCAINGGAASAACSLFFADSGFVVEVPDFPARRATSAQIKAVKKDDATQKCVPAFANVTRSVMLWSDYLPPDDSGRVVNWNVDVDGSAIGNSVSGAVARSLNFDGDGVATLALNYADVGNTRLSAVYNDSGLVMSGSGDFVAYPAGLCVTSSVACTDADETCPAAVKAGAPFTLDVTAVAWESDTDTDFCAGNSGTPSYRENGLTLSSVAVSPAPANSDGTVFPVSYDHSPAWDAPSSTGGRNTVSVTESDVGVFRFDVTAPAYRGYALGTYSSAPGGRFYPAHFTATVVDQGTFAPTCAISDAYAYIGEPVHWFVAPEFEITARNLAGSTTLNYTADAYRKLTNAGVSVTSPSEDDAKVNTAGAAMPVSVDASAGILNVSAPGVMQYIMDPSDEITYARTADSEVEPFTPALTYALDTVTDSDGVTVSASQTFSPASGFEMRYGRMWLENNHGSSTIDMVVPLRTEYFSGGRYILNDDDYCTAWSSADATVDPFTVSPATWITNLLASSGMLSAGTSSGSGLILQSPLTVLGYKFTGTAKINYDAPAWLQFDYDSNGSEEDPGAEAAFGVARGHERIIFTREIR